MREPLAVGAREFKTRLGTYLRQVREGRTLTITDRGRPVATVTPVDMADQSVEARLARLRAEGVVTGTGKPLSRVRKPVVMRGRPLSETIMEDREDRF
jgi:prevent-host-death family protein